MTLYLQHSNFHNHSSYESLASLAQVRLFPENRSSYLYTASVLVVVFLLVPFWDRSIKAWFFLFYLFCWGSNPGPHAVPASVLTLSFIGAPKLCQTAHQHFREISPGFSPFLLNTLALPRHLWFWSCLWLLPSHFSPTLWSAPRGLPVVALPHAPLQYPALQLLPASTRRTDSPVPGLLFCIL